MVAPTIESRCVEARTAVVYCQPRRGAAVQTEGPFRVSAAVQLLPPEVEFDESVFHALAKLPGKTPNVAYPGDDDL